MNQVSQLDWETVENKSAEGQNVASSAFIN